MKQRPFTRIVYRFEMHEFKLKLMMATFNVLGALLLAIKSSWPKRVPKMWSLSPDLKSQAINSLVDADTNLPLSFSKWVNPPSWYLKKKVLWILQQSLMIIESIRWLICSTYFLDISKLDVVHHNQSSEILWSPKNPQ